MAHTKCCWCVPAHRVTIVALTLGFAAGLHLGAATRPNRSAQAKAAALSNIIAFTEWPKTAFATADAPLVLGVVGEGPVSALLEQYLENEAWLGRRIILRRVNSSPDCRLCHVIFVADADAPRWRTFAPEIVGRAVLTVGDADGFAQQGGIVELGMVHDKVQLTINLGVARDTGLTLSSKLLRLAKVIGDRDP